MDDTPGPEGPLGTTRPGPGRTAERIDDGFVPLLQLAARLARSPVALLTGDTVWQDWCDPALRLDAAARRELHRLCRQLGDAPAAAVVPDAARDPRLWQEASVAGPPGLRFLASQPLLGRHGRSLGLLCVMDVRPRARLPDEQADSLADLAGLAVQLLERGQEAEAQEQEHRAAVRMEQLDAACSRAPNCEAGLASLLGLLCRHHGAVAGFVGRLSAASGLLEPLGQFTDGSVGGERLARTALADSAARNSLVAAAVAVGTPRVLEGAPFDEAERFGPGAQVIQPIRLLDQVFGIVLLFDGSCQDPQAVSADLVRVGRRVRPVLHGKAAERRLALLGAALDRVGDAVVVTEAGPLGPAGPPIVYANEVFCRESGYTLPEVLGAAHGMLHGRNTDPATVARLRAEMRRGRAVQTELLAVRRDGSEFWAELDVSPVMDEAGMPTHWVSVQRNAAERSQADHEATRRDMRRANEMLRERTQELHARTEELGEAQRLARLGTWRMSVDRQDVSWSREMFELMGMAPDGPEPESEALLRRIHPEDQAAVREALTAATEGSARRGFEYRVVLPGGEVRHLRAEVRPVRNAAGAVVELFGCSQDISERKRTEQALLRNESLRALGQLTGGVAHDFNNLLTVVILNLEEALDTLPAEHELQEVLSPALHAAVRGADLTSQLLSYARRATLRPERVRPDEFFGALRPLLSRVLGERFELQVLLRHNGGSAMVDPAQLDSAILNLVINARDAMPQGGGIVLETRSVCLGADSRGFSDEVTPGRYVVISVADKGEGIPAHLLARVFEPFFTTKEAGKGSGMGLSMVYGFARQSGGHVSIDSRPGEGTTVRLFLPVADGSAEDGDAEDARAVWNAEGMRVLLVEDQEGVLRTVARMLRFLGFAVTAAMSTDEALEILAREEPFGLLFTDIVLPGPMDGLALAEEVQAVAPQTRILLTSGFTEHSLSAQGMRGVDFLMKPYKRHDLQARFAVMFPHVDRR